MRVLAMCGRRRLGVREACAVDCGVLGRGFGPHGVPGQDAVLKCSYRESYRECFQHPQVMGCGASPGMHTHVRNAC